MFKDRKHFTNYCRKIVNNKSQGVRVSTVMLNDVISFAWFNPTHRSELVKRLTAVPVTSNAGELKIHLQTIRTQFEGYTGFGDPSPATELFKGIDKTKNHIYIITVNFSYVDGKGGFLKEGSRTYTSNHSITSKVFKEFLDRKMRSIKGFHRMDEEWGSQQTIPLGDHCE